MISISTGAMEESMGNGAGISEGGGAGSAAAEPADGGEWTERQYVPPYEPGEQPVNYEDAALVEVEVAGTDYRIDVGRAGTALCISTRPSGSWSWEFRGEARWQNGALRCKAFDRLVLSHLSVALAEAAASSQS